LIATIYLKTVDVLGEKITGKQHDNLKTRTMVKTLEITLKEGMNTKLSNFDDKGVFTDDDDTYGKHN
jgi:hypothetical protein